MAKRLYTIRGNGETLWVLAISSADAFSQAREILRRVGKDNGIYTITSIV